MDFSWRSLPFPLTESSTPNGKFWRPEFSANFGEREYLDRLLAQQSAPEPPLGVPAAVGRQRPSVPGPQDEPAGTTNQRLAHQRRTREQAQQQRHARGQERQA